MADYVADAVRLRLTKDRALAQVAKLSGGLRPRMSSPWSASSWEDRCSCVGEEAPGVPRTKVELFAAIRRDSRLEGLSVRALARKHGVHWLARCCDKLCRGQEGERHKVGEAELRTF